MRYDESSAKVLIGQATHLIMGDNTYSIDWVDDDFFQCTDEDNNTIQVSYADVDIENDMILKLLNP
jgi:hypothetical protein